MQTVLEATKNELEEAKAKITDLNLSMQNMVPKSQLPPQPQPSSTSSASTPSSATTATSASNPVPANPSSEDLATTTGVGVVDTDMRYISRAQPPAGSSNSKCAQCKNPIVGYSSLFPPFSCLCLISTPHFC